MNNKIKLLIFIILSVFIAVIGLYTHELSHERHYNYIGCSGEIGINWKNAYFRPDCSQINLTEQQKSDLYIVNQNLENNYTIELYMFALILLLLGNLLFK